MERKILIISYVVLIFSFVSASERSLNRSDFNCSGHAHYNVTLTAYYPDYSSDDESDYLDSKMKKLRTLQDFLDGRAEFVTISMDLDSGIPYGTKFCIPELNAKFRRQIPLQIRGLYDVWGVDYDIVMEIFPTITTQILATAIYTNGIVNIDKIRVVLLSIEKDCNRYTTGPQSTIFYDYKVQGRRVVINYSLYTYVTLFSYLAVPSVPLVLDVVMPLNQSREKQYIFVANYGVDNEEYYYYLCIHMYIGAVAVGQLFASCESMYMLYVNHADALLAILSHQLKTVHVLHPKGSINIGKDGWILEECDSREFTPGEQNQLYKMLCVCIQDHQNAIEYTELVESIFTKSLFFELFCTLIRLSITGAQTVLNLDDPEAVIRFGSFSVSQSFYILLLCLPGQKLLNHSENVFTAVCESMWYTFPKKSQNLYMFLLQRSSKPSKITALNIVPMTMETYLSIMKTAMSYFTVLLQAKEGAE